MAVQYYEGIGRRKAATARVRITAGGTGSVIINDKDGSDYLPRPGDVDILLEPLTLLGQAQAYDVSVHVNGGGISGQRDAILLGIARALLQSVFAAYHATGRRRVGLSTDSRTGALTLYERIGMRVRRTYTSWAKDL